MSPAPPASSDPSHQPSPGDPGGVPAADGLDALPRPLAALARSALRRPGRWLAAYTILFVLAASVLPSLEVRVDGESLHPADHATVIHSRADRERFFEPEQVILLARAEVPTGSTEGAPAWDEAAGLARLARLQEALERLPETQGDRVRSAVTLLAPPTARDSLEVRTFFDGLGPSLGDAPAAVDGGARHTPRHSPAAAAAKAAEVVAALRRHPLTEGLFLSADGRLAAFYLPLVPRPEEDPSRVEQLARLEARLPAITPPGTHLQLLGPAVAEARLGERVLADLGRLLPAMLLVVAAVLALALRSVAGVLVPLLAAGAALLGTFAAMALVGAPLTLVTTIVPVLLLAMAVSDEIHLLERMQAHLERGGGSTGAEDPRGGSSAGRRPEARPPRDRRRRAVAAALGQVGRPIVLTSLTTAAGFLSFLTAELPPVRDFGLFVALGILLALALSVTLVPALLVVLPLRWLRPLAPRGGSSAGHAGASADRSVARPETWAVRHPTGATGLAGLLLAALVPGIAHLEVQDSWIANFSPASALVQADRAANRAFWGTYRLDVVLEHPTRGYFQGPEGLATLERARQVAGSTPHVTGVVTHLLPYEMLAEGWDLPLPLSALPADELRRIAATVEVVARRIDLRSFLSPEAEAARARLLVRNADYDKGRAVRESLERELPEALAGSGVAWHLSGDLPLALDVVDEVVGDQVRSIAWTLVAVAILVALAVRRPRAVAAVLAPPLAAVAAVLGGMGWGGLPLGIATSTFAALTLGVGVDFGIHLEAAFRRRRIEGRRPHAALAAAFAGSGRALRWNTAVLATGFLVLTVSSLGPNRNLGFLLAAGLVASWLTTVLLLPALLAGRDGTS